MRPRVPPRAALCHRGRAGGAVWGTSLFPVQWPRFHAGQRVGTLPAGGAGSAGVPPGGGLRCFLQVGVRARLLLWGVSFAASESQCPDDLVCCVQRPRSGACFAWGRGFRHCCVAVPKSRGWGADFPWLVHVLWARRGVGGGARTPVPWAGIRVCVWALGAPPRGPWGSRCEGCPRPGALPPPAALLLGAVGARCPRAVGTGVRVRGPALSPWPVFPVFLRGGQPGICGPRVRCEGRLRSGAPPPPTVRPLGKLSGSVIHSRCGRGCAGVGARCCPIGLHALWGPRSAGLVGAAPGGVARHRCEGRLVSGAVPPPVARPLGGLSGSATHALWELRAARVVGGRPRGGGPATVARGVWCQTLSLPQPPALWGGSPGFRDPCVPGAGVGTQHRPHSVRPCGTASLAAGVAERRPRGGAFHCCEARLMSGAVPPLTARPLGWLLGSTTHMLWARACGCGGPTLSPWPACPGGASCCEGGRGPSPGGVACRCCERRLVSGAVPPPAARPLGRAAGVPRPVCPGRGRCGRGDPAPAPQHAPLWAGVARCGGGGRASPGGVPSTVVRGI